MTVRFSGKFSGVLRVQSLCYFGRVTQEVPIRSQNWYVTLAGLLLFNVGIELLRIVIYADVKDAVDIRSVLFLDCFFG